MGWECYYSGNLPDVTLQEKTINFVKSFFTSPPELIVTPDPDFRCLTKLHYWQGKECYDHYMPEYPFNYYGVIPFFDRSDGTIYAGGQFLFDRNTGGRLVSFEKLPDVYLQLQTGEQSEKAIEDQPTQFPAELTLGGSVRKIYGFALLLSVIKLRWWPDLECCDDDDYCQLTFQRIWKYGLASKLMDESLDYNACCEIMKKEHEKYFPPEPPEQPAPPNPRPVLKSVPAGILEMAVSELELSVRTSNCLRNSNIATIGELTRNSETELRKIPNMGRRSIQELNEVLGEYGLFLK